MVYLNPKTFICKHCGECCKSVVKVMADEIKMIEQAGYKNFLEVDPIRGNNEKDCIRKNSEGYCVFLTRESESGRAACRIYNLRPKVCRIYPFFGEKKLIDCKPKTLWDKSGEIKI